METQIYTSITITDSPMKLIHRDSNNFNILVVEEKYNAKYLGEFCLKTSSGEWSDQPYSLFYTPEAHPQGSNYFAIYYMWDNAAISTDQPKPYITNGISAVIDKTTLEHIVYTGVDCLDGNIIYSAYRHDMQTYKEFMIDGGRDYTRRSLDGNIINFIIKDGQIVKCDNESI